MAKKTENQVYDAWIKKQAQRHSQRKADPLYQKIIQELLSIRAKLSTLALQRKSILSHLPKGVPILTSHQSIKDLKAVEAEIRIFSQEKVSLEKELLETFGPIDPALEDISDEELMLFTDYDSNVNPFHDVWVVEPLLSKGKDPFPKVSEGLNKINWDAYLNERRRIRFLVRTDNPREIIQERLGAILDILGGSNTITFKRKGAPSVKVVGSLIPQEVMGAIIELNPFASKREILKEVVQTLRKDGFVFSRKDSYHPERGRAKKLRHEGKNLSQIARELWPREFKRKEKRLARKENISGIEREEFYRYVIALEARGYSTGQAFEKAEKEFRLKGKKPTNPLIIKTHRLIK